MFTNLANYFLGSIVNQDQGATAAGVEDSSVRLTSVDQEDDWVLVDRESDNESDNLSIHSLEDGEYPESDTAPSAGRLTRASSTSSLPPYTSNMEDSWFITPPPCFTSAGPVHMETSPLENLLIEHPSMSVYYNYSGRRHVFVPVRTPSPDPIEVAEEEVSEEVVEEEVEEEEDEVELEQQIPVAHNRTPRLNRLQIIQQQERQVIKSRRAQKAQVKKACDVLKRGCLQRNNKAREVNCRNRRQRRGERSQGANRSFANNNRKC